jgi:hypothetical protein
MANKKIWLGILIMVLVFGLTVVGCDDGNSNGGVDKFSDLHGNWTSGLDDTLSFWTNSMFNGVGFSFSIGAGVMGSDYPLAYDGTILRQTDGDWAVTATLSNDKQSLSFSNFSASGSNVMSYVNGKIFSK